MSRWTRHMLQRHCLWLRQMPREGVSACIMVHTHESRNASEIPPPCKLPPFVRRVPPRGGGGHEVTVPSRAASRSQSAPHMHVLMHMQQCSAVHRELLGSYTFNQQLN